jgi:hypothetical protein
VKWWKLDRIIRVATLITSMAIGSGDPDVKDYKVNFDGDLAKGQFLTQVAGKDVWVTLAGHLGSKDGYATFDPTEFKVGDLSVSQRRLAEEAC